MRTEITRPQYERDSLRYASDLSDAECDLIAPYMPLPKDFPPPSTVQRAHLGSLAEALEAFLAVLDRCTLADVMKRRSALMQLLTAPTDLRIHSQA